jgi:KEOPS complex subunit Cgi121
MFEIASETDFLKKIRKIADSLTVYIVFFDRTAVAGCSHIRTALSFAERSFFEYKTPVSNFFEMETLLYTFGTRQTGFASSFGIHRGANDSVILICRREGEEEPGRGEELFDAAVEGVVLGISSLTECAGNGISPVTGDECREFVLNRTGENIAKIAEIFSITREEIEICGMERLEELVTERCALLDVNK